MSVVNISSPRGGERKTTGVTFLGMQGSEIPPEQVDWKPLMQMDVFLFEQIEFLIKRVEYLELPWWKRLVIKIKKLFGLGRLEKE